MTRPAMIAAAPRRRHGRVPGLSLAEVVAADFAKMNAKLEAAGAVVTFDDGSKGIDPTKVTPELLSAYSGLTSLAYATGVL